MTKKGPGAASLAAASNELIGPFSGAVQPQQMPWINGTDFDSGGVTHWPLVLVRVLTDLQEESLVVTVSVKNGPDTVCTFAPWTEQGSELVAHVPATDARGAADAFIGTVAVTRTLAGVSTALGPDEVVAAVSVDLTQGLLGRLTAVLVAEKARLRRQSRELRAARVLVHAHDSALDRLGEELSVPRLTDRITWDAAGGRISTAALPNNREDDADYRSRLRVTRGVRLPSPVWIDANVNGPGAVSEHGSGWMADVGLTDRITVDEAQNPLFVAFRLVAPGIANGRQKLLNGIRNTHLIWPASSAAGDTAHAARLEPPAVAARVAGARASLKALKLPATQPVAPALAFALQRLDQLQTTLGVRLYSSILSGQRDDGGSRYELGFGAQFAGPTQNADLAAAVSAAKNHPELGLTASEPKDDPVAAWLLTACGLRTVQRLEDGTVYVSSLPVGGLVVDLTPTPESAVPITLAARLETGDGSTLDAPLAGVVKALNAAGLATTNPAPVLAFMQASAKVPNIDTALANLRLPRVTAAEVADVKGRFAVIANRDYAAFDLGAAQTAAIADDPNKLATIATAAARSGASSLLPVITAAGTLALVLGVVDLPLAGNNLAAQHTVAFRWQSRSLDGTPARLSTRRGATTQVVGAGTGIGFVTCLAYVRTGANDPYQWRPTLPDGVLLDLRQYEHLMNIVERVTPVGVQANTWGIRQRHVDVDGTKKATPLGPAAARTYHRYRTR
ncbi:hypothetical protein [Mycobacterium sp.]|uniref:hypothetical protein n=1 Tax=Mycobacterium sp. TaxID=1785 RepID=UPI003D11BCF8